jgi:hypothetical protein
MYWVVFMCLCGFQDDRNNELLLQDLKKLSAEIESQSTQQHTLLRKYEAEELKQREARTHKLQQLIADINALIEGAPGGGDAAAASASSSGNVVPLSLAHLHTLIAQLSAHTQDTQSDTHTYTQLILKKAQTFMDTCTQFVGKLAHMMNTQVSASTQKFVNEQLAMEYRKSVLFVRLLKAATTTNTSNAQTNTHAKEEEVVRKFEKMCQTMNLSANTQPAAAANTQTAKPQSQAQKLPSSSSAASSSLAVSVRSQHTDSSAASNNSNLPTYVQDCLHAVTQLHKKQQALADIPANTHPYIAYDTIIRTFEAKLRTLCVSVRTAYTQANVAQMDYKVQQTLLSHVCECVELGLQPLKLYTNTQQQFPSSENYKHLQKALLSLVQTLIASVQTNIQLSDGDLVVDQQVCAHALCLHMIVCLQASQLPVKLIAILRTLFMDTCAQTIPRLQTQANTQAAAAAAATASTQQSVKLDPANYLTYKLFAALCAFTPTGTLSYTPSAPTNTQQQEQQQQQQQQADTMLFSVEYAYVWLVRFCKQVLTLIKANAGVNVAELVIYFKDFLKYTGYTLLSSYGQSVLDLLTSVHTQLQQPQVQANAQVKVLAELIANVLKKKVLRMVSFEDKYLHVIGSIITFR